MVNAFKQLYERKKVHTFQWFRSARSYIPRNRPRTCFEGSSREVCTGHRSYPSRAPCRCKGFPQELSHIRPGQKSPQSRRRDYSCTLHKVGSCTWKKMFLFVEFENLPLKGKYKINIIRNISYSICSTYLFGLHSSHLTPWKFSLQKQLPSSLQVVPLAPKGSHSQALHSG